MLKGSGPGVSREDTEQCLNRVSEGISSSGLVPFYWTQRTDESDRSNGNIRNELLDRGIFDTLIKKDCAMIKDPVCGMTVDVTKAIHAEKGGKVYYFCCRGCKDKFMKDDRDPAALPGSCCHGDAHKGPEQKPISAGQSHGRYLCPMHPEIEQDDPGDCPKCGMALEPRSATDEGTGELSGMQGLRRKFWMGLVLSVPVFVLALAGMFPFLSFKEGLSHRLSGWLQLGFATPVVFWCGGFLFVRAWKSMINRSPNMFTLIAMGVGAAYGYSAAVVLVPHLFPDSLKIHGHLGLYFESAAVITVLVILGQYLEARARAQTGQAIKALLGWPPRKRIGSKMAGRKTSRLKKSAKGICCGYVLEKKCLWMEG
ncbi:MAG: heavy metal-binding domain-containing protein, partial [Candidatus Omnitrophota bacterium]